MADSRRVSTICRAKKVDRKRRARAQMSPSRSLTKLCNAAYSLNQYGPSAAQYIEVQPGGASMNNRAEIMPKGNPSRDESHVEAAAFHDRLFCGGCRGNDRLGIRAWLGRSCGCELAPGLVQVLHELYGLGDRTADHDPERKVHFTRDHHRASPLFDFSGLKATNARQGTKVPANDFGQFKVLHRNPTTWAEDRQ